jgi:hypothetical protein
LPAVRPDSYLDTEILTGFRRGFGVEVGCGAPKDMPKHIRGAAKRTAPEIDVEDRRKPVKISVSRY